MTDNWKKLSDLYGGHPAFISTNGLRMSPPMGCGLTSVGCVTIDQVTSWNVPVYDTQKHDILDVIEMILVKNAHIIACEFEFEAGIKYNRSVCDTGVFVTTPGIEKAVKVCRDEFFQQSKVTYASWSLMYQLRQCASIIMKIPHVHTGKGACPASPVYLTHLFKAFDSVVDTSSHTRLKRKLVQSQHIAGLFVKALYGFDEITGFYTVGTNSVIGMMFPGVDKNFIQAFKKAWRESRMMKAYAEFRGGGVSKVVAELWHVYSPPMFKAKRESVQTKRAIEQIQNPIIVSEKIFRRVVSEMIEVVFKGVRKWDTIEIPYDDTRGDRCPNYKRFNTALCLLQLGIGSRSRGVIGVNKIEQFDSPVLGDLSLMRSLDHRMALRVTNLTKDASVDTKAYRMFKQVSEFDNDFSMSDAINAIENSSVAIDKPVQFYLFDPVTHNASRGVVVDPCECYSGSCHHPRDVFMQLLKTCRDYIHSKFPLLVEWEQYHTGGRDIWMVGAVDRQSVNMNQLYRSVYPGMLLECSRYLTTPGLGLTSFSTHELRRLYVCYSFEFFGQGKTKEIAYAQYVLHHASLTSTVFYTTLQFDMFKRRLDDVDERQKKRVKF